MLTKTIEKTKDAAQKSFLVTTYRLFGSVVYRRTVDYSLAIEFSGKL